jgi:hypothetical protein
MTKVNMFFALGFLGLSFFAAPRSSHAQDVQQQQKTVKMNWSTLICFQDSANADKMFFVRGDDGLVYSMTSKEWDCGKYSRLFAIPSHQCDCVLKNTQAVATSTNVTAKPGEEVIAAGAVKVEPIVATQAPASIEPVGQLDSQKQREVRNEVLEIGKQAAEQGREVSREVGKEVQEIQNQDRGGVIVDDTRRDDRRDVRDERRDDRQFQRDARVDDRRNGRDERQDDRRGL